MLQIVKALPLLATVAYGQVDIAGILASLGPAPAGDPRFTNWVAPGPGDVRSPCPGLNTLANHGFIHHNGKNMTIPHLLQGLAAGLNIGPDFTVAIGGVGLLSSPNVLSGAFDLNDLDQHNFPIEHDASLSRQDAYFGNDYSFYNKYWQQVASFFTGGKTAILPAAKAISNRTMSSQQINPTFTYGFKEFILRYGETGLYLQTMGGDDATGVTRLDWVRSLFEKEKLPYALGWRPRAEPITLNSLGQMALELFNANSQKIPEGKTIVLDSYKDIFEVIAGGSNILNNITGGFAHAVGL